jgi:hypothetical protein
VRFWRDFVAERALRRRAEVFVRALHGEPADAAVQWLAERTAGRDADHARWELRYAMRALGLVVARRDALDDRTASAVAHALSEALRHDGRVAGGMRKVAERQFNTRLTLYADALSVRGPASGSAKRLGRALLEFSGSDSIRDDAAVAPAGDLLVDYEARAHESLRAAFGGAAGALMSAPAASVTPAE